MPPRMSRPVPVPSTPHGSKGGRCSLQPPVSEYLSAVLRHFASTLPNASARERPSVKGVRPLSAAPSTNAMNITRPICRGISDAQKVRHCLHAIRTAATRRLTSPASPWPAGRHGPSTLMHLRAAP
eukprot:7705744-Pyramimonas_sp.AAC.2